jgi:hypothetical protein
MGHLVELHLGWALLRLFVAMLCGTLLGLEREVQNILPHVDSAFHLPSFDYPRQWTHWHYDKVSHSTKCAFEIIKPLKPVMECFKVKGLAGMRSHLLVCAGNDKSSK